MKRHLRLHTSMNAFLAIASICILFSLASANTKGVKTSLKRYSIYEYKNEDVLCEHYRVKRNDWLYKLFRKKGEISDKDFPYFLSIFKKLNPQISNIDAIKAGHTIIIPLKKVKKGDYDLSTPISVDVPVIEFTAIPDKKMIEPFLTKHKIKRGDNISSLIDKDFLLKGGRLSKEGLKAFQLANPDIKNINIIFEGADIYLPDPSIKSQPWFQAFINGKPDKSKSREIPTKKDVSTTTKPLPVTPPKLEEYQLLELKKYTSLIGGTLMSQGKMYFPNKDGGNEVLDLSRTPVIETKQGQKILIMPGVNQNELLLKHAKKYWKNLKYQMMSDAIKSLKEAAKLKPKEQKKDKKPNKLIHLKKQIKNLLEQAGYDYIPEAKIPFTLNKIHLEASFGRVIREKDTDLLINFGNVYGKALDILKKKEFKIISITPDLSETKMINTLFSSLDFTTWKNPSFFTGKKVENLKGIYVIKADRKIFISTIPLSQNSKDYLVKEDVQVLSLNSKTNL